MLNISEIKFPIYILGKGGKVETENTYKIFRRWDGHRSIFDIESDEPEFIKRRLYLLSREDLLPYPLKGLGVGMTFFSELFKLQNTNLYHFIDSNGKVFKYNKTHRVKLTFHEIAWWQFINSGVSVALKLWDFGNLFEVPAPPPAGHAFAGVLHLSNKALVIHGYYKEKFDSTTRKI